MVADPRHLPLFVGLGVDEISVAPGDVPVLKSALARLSSDACARLLTRALSCSKATEVDALLAEASALAAPLPLVDPELVVLRDDSGTKAEAIHALVSALYVAGRTDAPDVVEEAVLAREATYSTGLGSGIAIPHCRTDAVHADSIVALRVSRPLDWGSMDGVPVRLVLLLATRASEPDHRHLQVFSGLARKLMHASFRDRLLACDDSAALVAYLSEELRLDGVAPTPDISLSGVSS
jgi:fructose-specific PTS system IIA-like component